MKESDVMSDERLADLIQTHLARYPAGTMMDVYKLLHQATFGPGHAITNKKLAREWLEHELALYEPDPGEPLVESIHPDGAIVRVHLRPYAAHSGDVKAMLNAFVRSAEQVTGDPAVMARRWDLFEALCKPGSPCCEQISMREAILFGRVRAQEGWPATHHSPQFNSAYHPVYRVMTRAEAEALCQRIGVLYDPL